MTTNFREPISLFGANSAKARSGKRVTSRENKRINYAHLDIVSEFEAIMGDRELLEHTSEQSSGKFVCACPFPDCSSENDAFLVWGYRDELEPGQVHFTCHRCTRRGSLFDFYQEYTEATTGKRPTFRETCEYFRISPFTWRADDPSSEQRGWERRKQRQQKVTAQDKKKEAELERLQRVYINGQEILRGVYRLPDGKQVTAERAISYLAERGFTVEQALQLGMSYYPSVAEAGGLDSPWRDRILFPLTYEGKIGFAGRSIRGWQPGMATVEHKELLEQQKVVRHWKIGSPAFYGYAAKKVLIAVEGEFDAASVKLALEGIDWVGVVAYGKNFRADYVPLGTSCVVLGLDGDGAGQESTPKVARDLSRWGIDVRIATPPAGKDWNECHLILGLSAIRDTILAVVSQPEETLAQPTLPLCEQCAPVAAQPLPDDLDEEQEAVVRKVERLFPGTTIEFITVEQLDTLPHAERVGLDLETTGTNPRRSKISFLQTGTMMHAYILDMRPYHRLSPEEQAVWKQHIVRYLSRASTFVGHNIKFDCMFLYQQFGVMPAKLIDTMLQEQIIHSVGRGDNQDEDGKKQKTKKQKKFVRVGLGYTAERYGMSLEKESQSWFIDLDKPRVFFSNGMYCLEQDTGRVSKKDGTPIIRRKYWFTADGIATKEPRQPKRPKKEDVEALKRYQKRLEKFQQGMRVDHVGTELWDATVPDVQKEYMGNDIFAPLRIAEQQDEILRKYGLMKTARLENMAIRVFVRMELAGILIDQEKWMLKIAEKEQSMRDLEEAIRKELTPEYRKVYADEQVTLDVYEREDAARKAWDAQIKTVEKADRKAWLEANPKPTFTYTKKQYTEACMHLREPLKVSSDRELLTALRAYGINVYSTKFDVLVQYAKQKPIVEKVSQYKKAKTFVTGFGRNKLAYIDPETKRLYPEVHQIGADTGRTSYSSPSFQNIPAEKKAALTLKRAIVARPGYKLLTADLPGSESRILAEISGDTELLDIFQKGLDFHSMTAIAMFNLTVLTPEQISDLAARDTEVAKLVEEGESAERITAEVSMWRGKSCRSSAKSINFGLPYGRSGASLAGQLGVTKKEGDDLLSMWADNYKDAWKWLEDKSMASVSRGYSVTRGGRRKLLPTDKKPANYSEYKRWKANRNARQEEARKKSEADGVEYAFQRTETPDEFKACASWASEWSAMLRQAKNSPIQGTGADIIKYALILLERKMPKDWCEIVLCVHDEIVCEVEQDHIKEVTALMQKCMLDACAFYLPTLAKLNGLGKIDVHIADYWDK